MAERLGIGDEPTKSGGDPNILQLKDQTKIRLVDESGTGVIAWRQHTIKHADDDQQVEFVVCPGPRICPLCRKPTSTVEKDGRKEAKQNFPISKRFATNVWDYGSSSLKVLIAGPQVFEEFKAAKAVNIDPTSCDWMVHKMGKGIQTKYKLVRDNASPFAFADQVGPDSLVDLDKYGADTAPERIFELLEKAGIDYDAIETQTFTTEEALEFVLPFGRCKGLTVEQALAQDQEWCEWLHGEMLKEERFAEPIFLVLQTAMQERGIVGPVDESPIQSSGGAAPVNDERPVEETPVAASEPEMVTLIATDGSEQTVPKEAEAALLAAGYTVKEEPEPEEAEPTAVIGPPYTMTNDAGAEVPAADDAAKAALEAAGFRVAGGTATAPETLEVTYPCTMVGADGSEVPAPTPEARAALESAGFTLAGSGVKDSFATEEPEPSGPEPILAEETVTVTIAGSQVPMAFKAALATAKAGTPVEFEDGNVADYAALLISTGGEPPETEGEAHAAAVPPAQSQAMHDMHQEAQNPESESSPPPGDPDKPFACQMPDCGWAGKTKGSLTQHMKREHADEAAVGQDALPSQPAVAANGATASDDVRDRVRQKLSGQPTKDYKKLLSLFEEVTKETSGAAKRDISKFTDEELLALETKIDEGVLA